MAQITKRIEKLRLHALNKDIRGIRSAEGELLWNRGWLQNYDEGSNIIRRAKTKAYVLKHSTPVIDEDELIVGKPCYRQLTSCEQKEWAMYSQYVTKASPRLEGQGSHMAIDYEKLLKIGITGVKNEINAYRAKLQLHIPEDMDKENFYQACLHALEGVLQYAENYACYAEELANKCSQPIRKAELLEIARICRKVPRYPADTFYEALQSIHFITFCMEGLYQLGRPDRYLIEYYRRDQKSRILTPDLAQELIDCLCILFNEYIPRGLAVGFTVGGRDAQGNDVTNELTYHFIESINHTRMIYPGIGLCYTKDTPQDLLERCCELLADGLSHPALFNDEVITRGLRGYGLSPEEACLYIHSTCVEITPIASSAVWVASPYINLLEILLDLMGVEPVSSREASIVQNRPSMQFRDFNALKEAYRIQLGEKIRQEVINQNRIQMERYYHGGDPLVSCFVNDCLSRGKDIDQGGARYNWIMPSFVGLANLADSLMALQYLVFQEQKVSLEDLVEILQENYQGREDLRLEILNRIPKYGNDEDVVDGLVQEITGWILQEISKYKTYRVDRFVPSLFCWIMHEQMGSMTPASPDGRAKGFPLGDGSGPAQGREKKGPTASILSTTKWEHTPFIGGIAVNMKFGTKLLKGESLGKMLDLIKTFMERGGFEFQINVVDKDALIKAQKNPEEYRDLVVRIGGYSDYFIHLPPAMQEEIILRTQHEI
jgi:pyruvate-formate lyase